MNRKIQDIYRFRRVVAVFLILLSFLGVNILASQPDSTGVLSDKDIEGISAMEALDELVVKGRAPKTGYSRSEFGSGWASVGGCDMRNIILQSQLQDSILSDDECIVLSGQLSDPYTNDSIDFIRGSSTSSKVQIDHVVALSDSWQKGSYSWDESKRIQIANDPLNLLAVSGPANLQKGDSDAASWLPPNKSFRCRYVARQIAVKKKYEVWITSAEKSAMKRVLNGCPGQILPIEE